MLQKIVEMSVPHKAAADGVQYAVSTKVAAAKEKRATDDDKSINIEDKTVCVYLFSSSYIRR